MQIGLTLGNTDSIPKFSKTLTPNHQMVILCIGGNTRINIFNLLFEIWRKIAKENPTIWQGWAVGVASLTEDCGGVRICLIAS